MMAHNKIINFLAVLIIVGTFGLKVYSSFNPDLSTEWAENISLIVVGYFFGSSMGSRNKSQIIDSMEQKINSSEK